MIPLAFYADNKKKYNYVKQTITWIRNENVWLQRRRTLKSPSKKFFEHVHFKVEIYFICIPLMENS